MPDLTILGRGLKEIHVHGAKKTPIFLLAKSCYFNIQLLARAQFYGILSR